MNEKEEREERQHQERLRWRFERQMIELETETQQMEQTLERMCGEILEAEREREALEARRAREEEERTSRERARREASAAAARWSSLRLPVPEQAPPEGPVEMEINGDATTDAAATGKFCGKIRKYNFWAGYAMIITLTIVAVALLGVTLSSSGYVSGHNSAPNNLRGTDNVEGDENGLKAPPLLPAHVPVPSLPSSSPAAALPVTPPPSSSRT